MKSYLYKRNHLVYLFTLILLALKTVLTIFVAIVLSTLINTVSVAVTEHNFTNLISLLYICIAYAIVLGISVLLSGLLKAHCITNIMTNLKSDTMQALLHRSISKYNQADKGSYFTLFSHNMNLIEENYVKNHFEIFTSIVSIVVASVVLIRMNIFVAVFSLVLMCIPSLIPKLFTKKLAQLQKDSAVNNSKYTNKIKEIFDGYATIKNYSLEYQFNDFQKSDLLTSESAKRQVNIEMSKLYALANIASILTQFSIMLFAGFLVVRGELTLGSIVAVTQLSGQVISPAFQLSAKIGLIKSVKPIIAQITEILAESTDALTLPDNKQTSIHDIEFKKVSFSYEDRPILRDVSFRFEKGKKYALVGESGSGKSTILKLLMQYYNNYSGNILIDHRSLNNYSSFFEECAYVSQDTFLFEDSVKNNLCLYKNVSENHLNDVIEKTGLTSVIQKLPDGINTILNENGNNLSGGERQRMAIARALLHNKKTLLFDEATSALDAALAEKIEDLILSLENTTCIFVSHKLNQTSYDQFDAILNLSDGQLSKAIA